MSGQSRSLVRNTVLYLPAQFFPPALQFATTIVWTYLLDPAAFGVVAFIVAIQEIAAFSSLTWWSLFILRFRGRYAQADDARLKAMDRRMIALAACVQVGFALPALWLAGASLSPPLFVATVSFFITRLLFTHYGEWVRAEHLVGAYTLAQIVGAFASAGLSILALTSFGSSAAAALAGQTLGQVAALALLLGRAGLRVGLGRFDGEIFSQARSYGAPLLIGGFFGWMAGNSIRIVIQKIEGEVALGLFSVGWGLGQRIAAVLSMLFTAAAYPLAVQNLEKGDRRGALAQVSLNGVFLLAILAPAVAGAAMLSRPLATLMIGEAFRETTIAILPIALAASALRGLRIHAADQTMLLLERTQVSMRFTVAEALLNAGFCLAGLYWDGVVGAALGVLAATTLTVAGAFAYSFLTLDLPAPSAWTLARIGVATAIMSEALALAPPPQTIPHLVATVLGGASIYAGLIIATFPECRAQLLRQLKGAAA